MWLGPILENKLAKRVHCIRTEHFRKKKKNINRLGSFQPLPGNCNINRKRYWLSASGVRTERTQRTELCRKITNISRKSAGNVQDICRTCISYFRGIPGYVLDISRTCPGKSCIICQKTLGNPPTIHRLFLEMSWTHPGNILEMTRNVSGHVQEFCQTHPRQFQDISQKCPGHAAVCVCVYKFVCICIYGNVGYGNVMLCSVMLCFVMQCHFMSCHVMVCYVMSVFPLWYDMVFQLPHSEAEWGFYIEKQIWATVKKEPQ